MQIVSKVTPAYELTKKPLLDDERVMVDTLPKGTNRLLMVTVPLRAKV